MPIAYSAYTYQEATATNTITPTNPTNASGDLIIYFVAWANNSPTSFTAPAGYSTAFNEIPTGWDTVAACFYKISTGSESGVAITATAGGGADIACIAVVCTGAHATTPFDVHATVANGGGSNWVSPTITTTGNGALIFYGGVKSGTGGVFSSNQPAGTTLVYQEANSASWLGLAYASQGSAGATGDQTWTNTANATLGFSVAFLPAAGGGGPTGNIKSNSMLFGMG